MRYTEGSQVIGLTAGEYATSRRMWMQGTISSPSCAPPVLKVAYDPRRLQGVTIYREADRAFAVGDRVQFTAPDRERRVANRELGTVEAIDADWQLQLRLDSQVACHTPSTPLHLDHGYAVTSHSSQGQTADRVLLHVDTERAGESLVNQRLAYVAISRGRYDAQIYTNDKTQLGPALGRDLSHSSALELARGQAQAPDMAAQALQPAETPRQSIGKGISL